MFSTLIFGLVLSSATTTCPLVPQNFGKTTNYAPYKEACAVVLKQEQDKVCHAEFHKRSGHGDATFDLTGKKYGKSELTCKVVCDSRYYLTKGGKCKRHG